MDLALELLQLYRGLERAYGRFELRGTDDRGKVVGVALTRHVPVTVADWAAHLEGSVGLGIAPLRDDGTCWWGAIDVDDYRLDHAELNERVQRQELPLTVLRSKSGGAHLAAFFQQPVPARPLTKALTAWAACLGLRKVEIFPKQDQLLWCVEKRQTGAEHWLGVGEFAAEEQAIRAVDRARASAPGVEARVTRMLGNWLNMPYQGGARSTRYALGPTGVALSPEEFVLHARAAAITASELERVGADARYVAPREETLPARRGSQPARSSASPVGVTDDLLPEGPPCLNALLRDGIPPNNRNNTLFALAIYWKRADPDGWQERVLEHNRRIHPPVSETEARTLVRSAGRKGYNYRCSQPPLNDACDRPTCLTRRHGVGRDYDATLDELPLGTFVKIETNPPLWLLDVCDQRVELTTDQLMNQKGFGTRVTEVTNKLWPTLKPREWLNLLRDLLARVEVEVPPADATPEGQWRGHLHRFCTGRAQARSLDELLLGKPYTADGRTHFILADFIGYLSAQRVSGVSERRLYGWLREAGVAARNVSLKGKAVQVWSIPEFTEQVEPFDVPRATDAAEF